MDEKVYTLGYGGLRLDDFLTLVKNIDSSMVVDVRRFPRSRVEAYNGEKLKERLASLGISYVWLGELGALGLGRVYKPNELVECTNSYTFQVYLAYLVSEPRALAALARIKGMAERGLSPVIICKERKPEHCHRQYIADALVALGLKVVHLVGGDALEHSGTPCFNYIRDKLKTVL